MKENKYRNTRVEYQGIKFDSKREQQRYLFLKEQERRGIISDIVVHPKFQLLPPRYEEVIVHLKTKDKIKQRMTHRPVTYTADFQYTYNGNTITEDVKISEYLLPKEYILKERMMLHFHNITIKRIYKPTQPIT